MAPTGPLINPWNFSTRKKNSGKIVFWDFSCSLVKDHISHASVFSPLLLEKSRSNGGQKTGKTMFFFVVIVAGCFVSILSHVFRRPFFFTNLSFILCFLTLGVLSFFFLVVVLHCLFPSLFFLFLICFCLFCCLSSLISPFV